MLDVVAERVDRHICGLVQMIRIVCLDFYRLVVNVGLLSLSLM